MRFPWQRKVDDRLAELELCVRFPTIEVMSDRVSVLMREIMTVATFGVQDSLWQERELIDLLKHAGRMGWLSDFESVEKLEEKE